LKEKSLYLVFLQKGKIYILNFALKSLRVDDLIDSDQV